jgi:hypothetical protein
MSNHFFSSHKLKIYHISVAKYVSIIKQGCGANNYTIIFFYSTVWDAPSTFIPRCVMHNYLLFRDAGNTIDFYSAVWGYTVDFSYFDSMGNIVDIFSNGIYRQLLFRNVYDILHFPFSKEDTCTVNSS